MTTQRTIKKSLITQEDIEIGEGTVSQSRNGNSYVLNKFRHVYPANSLSEITALDTDKWTKATLYSGDETIAPIDYEYISGSWKAIKSGKQTWYFATVSDMANAAWLAINDVVIIGERANSLWKVIAATTNNGYYILDGTSSGVSVELKTNQYLETKSFGALHDGSTDDTDALQAATDFSGANGVKVYSSAGTAMVDAVNKNVNIATNTVMEWLPGSKWKAITNSSDSYIVLDIRNVQNVYLYSPVLEGDKDTHTGGTGEQGHTLNISSNPTNDTNNINIFNPRCSNTWGDGIVIRKGDYITIHNAYCDDCRRNGVTINKGRHVYFTGVTRCINTNGISPEAGFDIEPNDATGEMQDIFIEKLYTEDNVGPGLTVNIGDFPDGGRDKDVSITILEHEDNGSVYGMNLEKMAEGAVSESVTFTDAGDLVNFTSHPYNEGDKIQFASITTTTGISVYTDYYVINSNTNDFQISTSVGGSAVTLTNDGSGEISSVIKGTINIMSQTYSNTNLSGIYVNDYAANNTPKVYMPNLKIFNPNSNNSSSSLFGAGIAIERKVGSGLTNNIGNIHIKNPVIVDSRSTNYMTRGISAQDSDGSGADLENFYIQDPLKISGYDSGDFNAAQINYNGMKISDKFNQFAFELTGNYTISSRNISKLFSNNATGFTVTDGRTRDNAGLDLELLTTGSGGITFTPSGSREVRPISEVGGASISATKRGSRIKLDLDIDDDHWYVKEQVGQWAYTAFTTYDPPSIANNASDSTDVTVTGARQGDFAEASFTQDTQGIVLDAAVTANDTVTVTFSNNTGGAVDLSSGTIRVSVTNK